MKIKNILLSILVFLFFANGIAVGQDGKTDSKPKKVRLKLEYLKLTDGTKVLKSKLYWKDGKKFVPVVGQGVTFIAEGDTAELKLGKIKTNDEGFAILHIEKGFKFPTTAGGFTNFTAKMKKSDEFKRAKKAIEIKDAALNISLDILDSIKTVSINVTTIDSAGNIVPAENTEVYVYVKRLYSLFKIENGKTDQSGQYKVVFPNDMPGDSIGSLSVIVKVLESDEYGTIEKEEDVRWGTVVSYVEKAHSRALWTAEAPLWMIIATLIILLGAWFNFILAIYKVSKIKKVA